MLAKSGRSRDTNCQDLAATLYLGEETWDLGALDIFRNRADSTMGARIYRPAKNAMQSGKAKTRKWVLEFEPGQARRLDPLMGWTGSSDMNSQVHLTFDTMEEAVAYAQKHGLAYQVAQPKAPKRRVKTYADNFKFGRVGQWTH